MKRRKPYNKPALTYTKQLEKLKQRGLVIEDDSKALHLLEAISYFRLSRYWYPLLSDKENHIFKEGATFNTVFQLYKFDRELRVLVLRQLEKIEIAVRAKMIYNLSHEIDPFWYQDKTNFRSWDNFGKTLAKIKEEYSKSDDQFIRDFKKGYQNELPPSWIILEITSFGVLSSLYYNLNPGNIKNSIANHFGLNDKTFASWLHSIVYIRNVCAHHSRLWNRVLGIQPLKPRKTKYQWLNNRNIPNNRVYFILSMILYFMNIIQPYHTIPVKFKTLLNNYPNIDTKAMGFPETWENESLWK